MEENKLDNFDEMIGKVYSDVVETHEEFVFKTVNNWLSKNYMTVVSKKELVNAVTLLRTINEYDLDIHQLLTFVNAYDEGYKDGRKRGHQDVMDEIAHTFKEMANKNERSDEDD